jgi:hypothetical protein
MVKTITICRICGGGQLTSLMLLENQMLTGVFPKTKTEKITSGSLELVKCTSPNGCGLVQLRQSYDLSEMYGLNYGYRSGLNASMVKHLHSKVAKILDMNILKKDDLIIDIGSNDATTLLAYPQGEYNLVGIDPTGIKFSQYYPKGVRLIPEFFCADVVLKALGNKKAKVITAFSMFYDLEDPIAFATEIASTLDNNGIWIFEQSYLPAMLRTNSFDTICHEHLEFYALKQILWVAEKAGLKVLDVDFNDVNGGSFSIICGKIESKYKPNQSKINQILMDETTLGLDTTRAFDDFKVRVEKARNDLMSFLKKAKSEGKRVYGLGASTKGNVLLQYYGISDDLISFIGEVNSDKFGSFTPGTFIPIISQEEMLSMRPDYLLVLPWHFRSFFESSSELEKYDLIFPLPEFEVLKK